MVEWSTALITPPPAAFTAPSYTVVLSLNSNAIATVSVLVPIESGVLVPPNNGILKPGDTTTILDRTVIAYQQSPPAILYRDDQSFTITVTSSFNSASKPTATPSSSPVSVISGTKAPTNALPSAAPKYANYAIQSGFADLFETGILSFFAGFIACTFLVLFAFRDRLNDSHDVDLEHNNYMLSKQGQPSQNKHLSLESEAQVIATSDLILPPEPDETAISERINDLFSSIYHHVQAFYHSDPVSPGLVDQADIHILRGEMPMSKKALCTWIQNPETRETALRSYIAWFLLNGMDLCAEHSNTFLPASIFHCVQQLRNIEHESTYHTILAEQWRIVAAKLMQSYYQRRRSLSMYHSDPAIQAAIRTLDDVLQPYADLSMDDELRKRDLINLLKRAVSLSFALYSREGHLVCDWKKNEVSKSESICVFPAVFQVEQNGQAGPQSIKFNRAVIESLKTER